MIIILIIGFILTISSIYILKNSRTYYDNKPVLKMWHLLLLGIGSLIPVINFIAGTLMLIAINIAYGSCEYKWKEGELNKLIKFLNKEIK